MIFTFLYFSLLFARTHPIFLVVIILAIHSDVFFSVFFKFIFTFLFALVSIGDRKIVNPIMSNFLYTRRGYRNIFIIYDEREGEKNWFPPRTSIAESIASRFSFSIIRYMYIFFSRARFSDTKDACVCVCSLLNLIIYSG